MWKGGLGQLPEGTEWEGVGEEGGGRWGGGDLEGERRMREK